MSSSKSEPIIAGTLQTDPRSGGLKRSSGVNILPIVAETWSEVRDNSNTSVDWVIIGYDGNSKTDITVVEKGSGGIDVCSQKLPENRALFGGCRLNSSGRFVTFFYADEGTPVMQRGRASMHKNGVMNVLEGSDGEIDMRRGLAEEETKLPVSGGGNTSMTPASSQDRKPKAPVVPKSKPSLDPKPPISADNTATVPKWSKPKKEVIAPAEMVEPTDDDGTSFPYEVLKSTPVDELPAGVDPSHREQALSDGEFMSVFGMDKSSFAELAGWKRKQLKKSKGLF